MHLSQAITIAIIAITSAHAHFQRHGIDSSHLATRKSVPARTYQDLSIGAIPSDYHHLDRRGAACSGCAKGVPETAHERKMRALETKRRKQEQSRDKQLVELESLRWEQQARENAKKLAEESPPAERVPGGPFLLKAPPGSRPKGSITSEYSRTSLDTASRGVRPQPSTNYHSGPASFGGAGPSNSAGVRSSTLHAQSVPLTRYGFVGPYRGTSEIEELSEHAGNSDHSEDWDRASGSYNSEDENYSTARGLHRRSLRSSHDATSHHLFARAPTLPESLKKMKEKFFPTPTEEDRLLAGRRQLYRKNRSVELTDLAIQHQEAMNNLIGTQKQAQLTLGRAGPPEQAFAAEQQRLLRSTQKLERLTLEAKHRKLLDALATNPRAPAPIFDPVPGAGSNEPALRRGPSRGVPTQRNREDGPSDLVGAEKLRRMRMSLDGYDSSPSGSPGRPIPQPVGDIVNTNDRQSMQYTGIPTADRFYTVGRKNAMPITLSPATSLQNLDASPSRGPHNTPLGSPSRSLDGSIDVSPTLSDSLIRGPYSALTTIPEGQSQPGSQLGSPRLGPPHGTEFRPPTDHGSLSEGMPSNLRLRIPQSSTNAFQGVPIPGRLSDPPQGSVHDSHVDSPGKSTTSSAHNSYPNTPAGSPHAESLADPGASGPWSSHSSPQFSAFDPPASSNLRQTPPGSPMRLSSPIIDNSLLGPEFGVQSKEHAPPSNDAFGSTMDLLSSSPKGSTGNPKHLGDAVWPPHQEVVVGAGSQPGSPSRQPVANTPLGSPLRKLAVDYPPGPSSGAGQDLASKSNPAFSPGSLASSSTAYGQDVNPGSSSASPPNLDSDRNATPPGSPLNSGYHSAEESFQRRSVANHLRRRRSLAGLYARSLDY